MDETAGSVEVCVVVTLGIVGTPIRVTFDVEEASATGKYYTNLVMHVLAVFHDPQIFVCVFLNLLVVLWSQKMKKLPDFIL